MDRYNDMYYEEERPVRKTGRTSTRKKSTEPTTENGIISNAVCVKVREMPDPEAKVVSVANAKEKVKILGEENGYYRVELGDETTGYISSDFCVKER